MTSSPPALRPVGVGDLVPYRITARTQDNVARGLVSVVDILPSGFSYVPGTGTVNGSQAEPVISGDTLIWSNQIVPAAGSKTYDLVLRVGAGVTKGNRTNTAIARNKVGQPISNRAEAVVSIGPDLLLDCTDVIGKVFDDGNGNGVQDEGERGIANARLVTVNGLLVTSDANGRYHIACAATPNAMIGGNFVLKLDEASLPTGYGVTGGNPKGVRLTAGVMQRVDFTVGANRLIEDISAADFDDRGQLNESKAEAIIARIRSAAFQLLSIRLRYLRDDNEAVELAAKRLDAIEERVRRTVGAAPLFDRDIVGIDQDGRK